MRLYEFKDKDGLIDVTVTTDGSGSQKNVFVTATPTGKGYQISGSIKPDTGKIQELGFNFINGVSYDHQDFIDFALKAKLALTQWNEGLGELSPVNLTTTEGFFQYKVSAETSLSFAKNGESILPTVVSTKEVIIDGTPSGAKTQVGFTLKITEGSSIFSISENTTIKASANATSLVRYGKAVVEQAESDKTFEIELIQGA